MIPPSVRLFASREAITGDSRAIRRRQLRRFYTSPRSPSRRYGCCSEATLTRQPRRALLIRSSQIGTGRISASRLTTRPTRHMCNMGHRRLPAIQLTEEWWAEAVDRLKRNQPVPVYTRFALDATYFADHDPTRGIIMACSAWETALRFYLAEVASKRDPPYLLASSQ